MAASLSASSTFDGFTSRWTIPRRCACASASSSCTATSTALAVADLAGVQRLAQRAAGDVLVGDVDVAAVARERVDPLAARVAQRGGGLRLALGAHGRLALARDHLQRDVEAALFVAREPDVTHPARAQRPERSVTSEDELLREGSRRHPPLLLRAEEKSFARRTRRGRFGHVWTSATTTSSSTSSRTSLRRARRRRPRAFACRAAAGRTATADRQSLGPPRGRAPLLRLLGLVVIAIFLVLLFGAPDPVVREHVEARRVRELHGGRAEDRGAVDGERQARSRRC